VLQEMAADDAKPVDRLDLLSAAERRVVVEDFNATGAAHTAGELVHERFQAQAERTPGAAALVFEGETLSYAELNARANRLAHHLRAGGVGPERLVALCLDRTPDLVVAMLATLKAGGAYVPVDPAYPAGRIAGMVEDARAAVLLSHSSLAPHLPHTPARLLLIDGEADAIAARPSEDPVPTATEENTAYAIFTSGSTGRPKGVQIEHRSAVAILRHLGEMVTDGERSVVLASTSASFDVSVAEIHHALSHGATLHLVENAMAAVDLAPDAGVTFAAMVPSAAAELLRIGRFPASLRTVVLGGEAVPTAVSDALYEMGIERVINGYGPTEDTTYSTMWEIPRGAERMRIGRPVAGARAHVLDARLRPAPVGVPGELYMAGVGVARGYLNRPGLTAERFLPDPNGPPGSRMYRVGDRVRMRADGDLEYFGRLDHQVKVRGYRIEIGEIEAGLRRHPAVGDAVVVVREDEPGDPRIAAYVRPAEGETPAADGLRAHLQDLLPAYMVPSAFVVLDDFPRTPNGKVDRRALPRPDAAAGTAAAFVPPRDALEETIAEIWREVLGVERVGANDSFFDLGGHSLLLTQVHGKVRERVASDVPLMVLFRFPTVRSLAEHLGSASREEASADRGRERAEARRALRTRRRETRG
jgi:amino acid adenylation domain-containing protein